MGSKIGGKSAGFQKTVRICALLDTHSSPEVPEVKEVYGTDIWNNVEARTTDIPTIIPVAINIIRIGD